MASKHAAATASRVVAAAVVAYGFGTIPSAVIAVKLAGRGGGDDLDPRVDGTANPGAANVSQLVGKRWAAAVTVVDIAKGAMGSVVGRVLVGPVGAHLGATAAVAGHCYPLWPGSKGGKGVATSIGQVIATFPAYLPLDIVVATAFNHSGLSKQRTRFATNAASVVWVGAGCWWWKRDLPNAWGPRPSGTLPLASAATALIIAQRFRTEQHRVDAYNRTGEIQCAG